MRFSLQDIKKQVQRRGDILSVSLHFLRAGELRTEIKRLVDYHEHLLGRPQRDFSIEDARACIGDYRLAHCLIATLSAWYSWRQPDWQESLQRIGNHTLVSFEEAGITSPVHLRLALFNYVNEHYCGFLDAQTRTAALEKFAEMYRGKEELYTHALSVSDLEYLLALDSDEEALLMRDAPYPPAADQVASLYNQWAFEAALFNASDVHFVVDCNAFMETQNSDANLPATGVGAVIKRLCFLARKMGVYYDLAYDADSVTRQTSPSILHLTLYGPQEITGAPQQYGLRLANLSRILLGYHAPIHPRRGVGGGDEERGRLRRPSPGSPNTLPPAIHPRRGGGGEDEERGRLRRPSSGSPNTLPPAAILKAEATVHFLQRTYHFAMDTNLLNLLPPPSATNLLETQSSTPISTPSSSSIFDSGIEQSFAEAFHALANSDGADGWRLEREPEPLLFAGSSAEKTSSATLQGIFIPDFALTRGNLRIYVEILGFWTPAYRERKIAKLQLLKGRKDLVLAIPVEARDAYTNLAMDFPIVIYDGQLSATELLKVLRTHYDDLSERLAQINVDSVRKRIESEGLVPERACYALLHCYRRSELLRAAELVVGESTAFTPGVGLYHLDWLEQLRHSFVELLSEVSGRIGEEAISLPLPQVLHETRARWPALAACEDATLEALIGLWPEVYIRRISIFDATIEVLAKEGASFVTKDTDIAGESPPDYSKGGSGVEKGGDPSGRPRGSKKRIVREANQADLWS